jgi:hypothetical protein
MRPPKYHGDPEDFLRAWASYVREHVSLYAGIAFERLLEDLGAREAAYDLEVRDLHRDVEDLEAEVKRLSSR